MKYKLSVRIFLTYRDKDVKVEVELSDEEVARIKELVAKDLEEQKQVDGDDEDGEDDFVSPPDLLDILDRNSPELFDLLWDVIFPKVFVESLIDGIKNYGELVRHEDDHYRSHRKVSFDELYEMYGDDMEIDHYNDCICKIPRSWMPKNPK